MENAFYIYIFILYPQINYRIIAQASPAYEIVYFLQLLSGYTAYSAFCGICSLMAHFVTHVCGQCDMLAAIFEETVDGGKHNDGSIENRIATAVTRHLRLLR